MGGRWGRVGEHFVTFVGSYCALEYVCGGCLYRGLPPLVTLLCFWVTLQAIDSALQVREMMYHKIKLNKIMAMLTGQTYDQVSLKRSFGTN